MFGGVRTYLSPAEAASRNPGRRPGRLSGESRRPGVRSRNPLGVGTGRRILPQAANRARPAMRANDRQANRSRTRSQRRGPVETFPRRDAECSSNVRECSPHVLPFVTADPCGKPLDEAPEPQERPKSAPVGASVMVSGHPRPPLGRAWRRETARGRLRHADGRQKAAWAEARFSRPPVRSERGGNRRRSRP